MARAAIPNNAQWRHRTEPLPGEMLSSWLHRVAKPYGTPAQNVVNGISNRVFGQLRFPDLNIDSLALDSLALALKKDPHRVKAYVFSIINSKQTPVSGSLIYDLFDLSDTRSPQKTCHFVAKALNKEDGGPFFNRLKMLGRKEAHHTNRVMLSQGTFATHLLDLITRDAAQDARLEKARQPLPEQPECLLRRYYLRNEDETILKIIQNYFEAIRQTFTDEWESDTGEFVIRKSVGYTALMRVLKATLPDGYARRDLSLEFFLEKMAQYRSNLGHQPLVSANFPSNEGGAGKLYKALMGEQQAAVPPVQAPA